MNEVLAIFAAIGVICVGVFLIFCIVCGIMQIDKWIEKLRK